MSLLFNMLSRLVIAFLPRSKPLCLDFEVINSDSLEKTLMLGKTEGKRRRGQQRMRRLNDLSDSMDLSLSKHREIVKEGKPGVLQFMGSQRVRHDLATE